MKADKAKLKSTTNGNGKKTLADIIKMRKWKHSARTGTEFHKGYATGWHWAYRDLEEILKQHGVDAEKIIVIEEE